MLGAEVSGNYASPKQRDVADRSKMLRLESRKPIAQGGHRLVYQHPDLPEALVKVVSPEALRGKSAFKRWAYSRVAYYHPGLPIMTELAEYLSLRQRFATAPRFLPKLLRIEDTDLGYGLVVEKMTDGSGELAPNLGEVIWKHALDEQLQRDVDIFCRSLLDSRVVVSDLHLRNVLYAQDGLNGSRLVLVDGLGEKTFIRINRLSNALNRHSTRRHISRFLKNVELIAAERASKAA